MIKKSILFLKVLFVIIILLFGLQLMFALVPSASNQFRNGYFALSIPLNITNPQLTQGLMWYIFVCSIPTFALILYIIKKLIDLFVPLTKNISPFTSKSVFDIKKISYACFVYAVLGTLINFIGAQILVANFENYLKDWTTNLSLPVVPLLAGMLVLSLGEIFDRGLMLQQENDSIL